MMLHGGRIPSIPPLQEATMSDTTPAPAAAAPATPQAKPQVTFEEFARLDLRVARVLKASDHPQADRLFVLEVDDGSGAPRTLCAGIKGHYAADQLVGRLIVIVANLAPRKIRGVESRGMLLAASDAPKDAAEGERHVVILSPSADIPPGSIVS
jgi:methionine--tRNA ligase beta chain